MAREIRALARETTVVVITHRPRRFFRTRTASSDFEGLVMNRRLDPRLASPTLHLTIFALVAIFATALVLSIVLESGDRGAWAGPRRAAVAGPGDRARIRRAHRRNPRGERPARRRRRRARRAGPHRRQGRARPSRGGGSAPARRARTHRYLARRHGRRSGAGGLRRGRAGRLSRRPTETPDMRRSSGFCSRPSSRSS